MQEFKYKGIDMKKINEVQEIHNNKIPQGMRTKIDLDAMTKNRTSLNLMQSEIERYARRLSENSDIVVICEMAKRFLEQESEKIQTQEPKKVKLDWMKKFKGI